MLVGREEELKTLTQLEKSQKAELLVLYGRRRIGKSSLVQHFCKGKNALLFEAIEGASTKAQIEHFTVQLRSQIRDPLLEGVEFSDWNALFGYLTLYLERQKGKVILFFDELQWQAAGQTKLVGLLKYVWDNHWKKHAPFLILCGSIGSFMVRNVLRSKALYGRATAEMHLRGLSFAAAQAMLRGMRSDDEVLRYLLVFGGIPKYLEEIDPRKSFAQNMNRLCFSRDGVMVSEIDRIFASQFRGTSTYKRIVSELLSGPKRLKDISEALDMCSSGGVKEYLDNLILADLVDVSVPLGRTESSKSKSYRISDEFLCFYTKFILPNLKLIRQETSGDLFARLSAKSLEPWLGLAFERFCLKNAGLLARTMGFGDHVVDWGSVTSREGAGFQIDLAFSRNDKVITLCEIKYWLEPVDASVIASMERKCALFKAARNVTVERALITAHGVEDSLQKAGYFHHIVTLNDLF